MGSASSKASRSVARAAPKRQYPQRIPPNVSSNEPPPERTAGPSVKPSVHASETRDDTVNRDGADPDFARSLRSIGPVIPSSHFSNHSAFNPRNTSSDPNAPQIYPDPSKNPALRILEARNSLAAAAEHEFAQLGKSTATGRQFLDVLVIRQLLQMRDEQGLSSSEIERRLELREGVVDRLGRKGVVSEPN